MPVTNADCTCVDAAEESGTACGRGSQGLDSRGSGSAATTLPVLTSKLICPSGHP